jgi:hypothetical protein
MSWVNTYDNFVQSPQPAYQISYNVLDRSEGGLGFDTADRPVIIYASAPVIDSTATYAVAQAEDGLIMKTLEELKNHIRTRLGDSVCSFDVERIEEAGDTVNFVVLVAKLKDVGKVQRHELRRELYRMIGAANSPKVRERLTVTFR